mmetsp:Transcript_4031/g.7748  ORF Transcript_4031/g.7748 Transcript_4031/m.7748 type:complete len:210 (+) Transcript_4031:244-873(+)|eukprot:scaffold34597_cov177-Amphora_coffeaeformis.AAC.17
MCLAPKVRHFNSTTKAPVDLARLQQMKQFLPPKSKALKAKSTPSVEKKIEVSLKPKSQEPKPTVNIVPRINRQEALEAIFRDSFGASSSGDVFLFPSIQDSKSLMDPESPPCIKRTLSFSSVSSEITTPATNIKHTGTMYLFMDCHCEEEKKEECDCEWDDSKPPAFKGLSTPPITHAASLSPPPTPRPSCYWEQEVSFPETLWLPRLP